MKIPTDAAPKVRCVHCGASDAAVRPCERDAARITGRAHVDCRGHSVYRAVTRAEIGEERRRR